MNRDDIIRMAREAWSLEFIPESDVPKLERFAALVAAAEREECAQLLESGRISCPNNPDMKPYAVKLLGDAAFVIRKRGAA